MNTEKTEHPKFEKYNDKLQKSYHVQEWRHGYMLRGELGAVQFIYTDFSEGVSHVKNPVDVGYHSPNPLGGNCEHYSFSCPILHGEACYYNGSSWDAEEYLAALEEHGEARVYQMLEEYYKEVFDA